MLGTVPSATLLGIDGHAVTVEVHSSTGLPSFTVVGSPDSACREASGRVRAAMLSSGLHAGRMQRVTVNLAPPSVRKIGAGLDLAIAVAILVASEQVDATRSEGLAFLGELGLDGSVRPVAGTLCLTEALGERAVVLPGRQRRRGPAGGRPHDPRRHHARPRWWRACAGEQPWPDGPTPTPRRRRSLACPTWPTSAGSPSGASPWRWRRLGATTSSCSARRAPARRCSPRGCPGLLPPLTDRAALETTRIHSAAGLGLPPGGLVRQPPFRAPHHGASSVALVGGGSATMRPGEISAACNGVLFLDELAEFAQHVLDALRQPLEEGVVRVARAAGHRDVPGPVPARGGHEPVPVRLRRPPRRLPLHRRGPRPLPAPAVGAAPRPLRPPRGGHPPVGERPHGHRPQRAHRGGARAGAGGAGASRPSGASATNAAIPVDRLDELAPLHPDAADVLAQALKSGRLSARGLHRVRRVARTVADLQEHAQRRRHAPPTSPSR